MYLFKVSVKDSRPYIHKKFKPLYIVAKTKEDALQWANSHLKQDMIVHSISLLARQLSGVAFSGNLKSIVDII